MYRAAQSINRLVARSVVARHVAELHTSQSRQAITKFNMPAMSPTMTEGTITRWKKNEGDNIVTGDVLLEVETDKAQIDVEANEDGILAKILVGEGKKVPVNSLIALLAEEGDDLSNIEVPKDEETPAPAAEKPKPAESKPAAAPAKPATPPPASSSHGISTSDLAKPLSPAVLSLITRHHIADPSQITGSGPGGRILKGDVLAFLGKIQPRPMPPPTKSAAPAQVVLAKKAEPAPAATQAPSGKKAASKPTVPQYVQKDIVVDELVKFKRELNEQFNAHVSLDDFFVRAAFLALQDVPAASGRHTVSSIDADFAELLGEIAVPAAAPAGPITPIIGGAGATSEAIRELAARAKKGRLIPEEYRGGSFSISPQAGTLAIGAAHPDHSTNSPAKKTTPSTADDLDLISYLAGELPKPAALQTAAVEVERRLRGAVEPGHQVVSVKMGIVGGAVDKGVADKFLDRVGYYVANPENLML
ncbi:hypothetical protein BC937DRAFT_89247 [Endogone sp. FLAS-F59071]|nr:hypothetical protein BC937DRAFT_89247 [Endogone sp. FLAS-F59071]|eukprot:RUS18005.1 hypothetical protein BC937DRAFT_89247 [Endogone sp. FLAS-F59071]